jgi:pimeloyl-ACP methyl ester carboxylesterase
VPSSETPAPGTLSLDLPHGLHVEALTWGPDDGPLAVLLHGFPDTAHTWRHLGPALARDGWRVVAPFLRGYAPTGLAPDGSYHVPALCHDAITLHAALGGDERAVLVGHDWGAITANGVGAAEASPYSAIVSMAVPPVPALVPQGVGDAGLLAQQALMSWYTVFHQLPVLPERVFSRHVARLWRSWSPGYDPGEDLELLAAALPDRAHRRAAIDYYRAAPRQGRRPRRLPQRSVRDPALRGRADDLSGRGGAERGALPPARAPGPGERAGQGVPHRSLLTSRHFRRTLKMS